MAIAKAVPVDEGELLPGWETGVSEQLVPVTLDHALLDLVTTESVSLSSVIVTGFGVLVWWIRKKFRNSQK